MKQDRWKLHLAVAAVAIAAMTMALTPAVADPVPDTEEYPDVAFLARNDVPFDAQTAASMAAQLGAPMFITNPNALSDAAANGISDLNPDVIIVAGGEFAISEDVANAAAAECEPDCNVDRRFGAGRDQTAAALAEIAADYGFDRPVLQGSNHVAGDVHVGGTVSANALTVEDTGLVSGLNADQLDGRDDYFNPDNDGAGSGLDADLVDGKESTDFLQATIPSGTTVYGTIGSRVYVPGASDEVAANASLPGIAPVGLDDDHVVVDGVDESADECPGDALNPSADPGYVCMYPYFTQNATVNGGHIWGSSGEPNKWGFQISWDGDAAGATVFFANWAYTAP